jgi:hypothetical protein
MKYQSGGAFRRALEDRLRAQSLKSGAALVRLRKMVAFDRLVARLMLAQPDAWLLKGEHIPSPDNCLIRLLPGPQRFVK